MKKSKIISLLFSILLAVSSTAVFTGCSGGDSSDSSYPLVNFSAVQSETGVNVVTVTWVDSVKADKYYIYYNTTNNSSTAVKESGSSHVSKEYDDDLNLTGNYKGSKDVTLTGSGTYYFWVTAVDGSDNQSDFGSAVTITLE